MYQIIETQADIDRFLDAVNGLHDAHLIGAEYAHNGYSGGNPCWIDPEKTELRLRFLVTSIWDAIAELRFHGVREFRLREDGSDIIECHVELAGRDILWCDDEGAACSLVRAGQMSWCLIQERNLQ